METRDGGERLSGTSQTKGVTNYALAYQPNGCTVVDN